MATPVIRSFTPDKTSVTPGQTVAFNADAFDPDNRIDTYTLEVEDSQGNKASSQTVVTLGDPITYKLTCDNPNVVITQDPVNPNKFTSRY